VLFELSVSNPEKSELYFLTEWLIELPYEIVTFFYKGLRKCYKQYTATTRFSENDEIVYTA